MGKKKKKTAKASEDSSKSPASLYTIETYNGGDQLDAIISLMSRTLTEPYNIFTFRYFSDLQERHTLIAFSNAEPEETRPEHAIYAHTKSGNLRRVLGAIVDRVNLSETTHQLRGYIAMLGVDPDSRRMGIGRALTLAGIEVMKNDKCVEVYLETDTGNETSVKFYSRLGFFRDRLMYNYYMFSGDAYRLTLPLVDDKSGIYPKGGDSDEED